MTFTLRTPELYLISNEIHLYRIVFKVTCSDKVLLLIYDKKILGESLSMWIYIVHKTELIYKRALKNIFTTKKIYMGKPDGQTNQHSAHLVIDNTFQFSIKTICTGLKKYIQNQKHG